MCVGEGIQKQSCKRSLKSKYGLTVDDRNLVGAGSSKASSKLTSTGRSSDTIGLVRQV